MMKKKYTIAAGIGLVIVLVVIIAGIMIKEKKPANDVTKHEGYVFDRHTPITAKDIRIYNDPDGFKIENASDYFKKDTINAYTLKYFYFLDDKFKDSKNNEDLFKSVRDYLYSVMPPDQANRLFSVYKTYVQNQQDLYEKTKLWGMPSTPEQAIDYLYKLQEYRRQMFGTADADALFGPSVKLKEYPIRRGMIVDDKTLTGAEKEKKIDALKRDMWGDDANTIDNNTDPLDRYNEKLRIYQKDMAEMTSDDDRQAMIRKFRDDIFTPEQARRMDDVDRMQAEAKDKEKSYFAQEGEIKKDSTLDTNEKTQRIRDLQDQIFGTEANAFRRRLVIEKGVTGPETGSTTKGGTP